MEGASDFEPGSVIETQEKNKTKIFYDERLVWMKKKAQSESCYQTLTRSYQARKCELQPQVKPVEDWRSDCLAKRYLLVVENLWS
jgi:hypothetical protein